jgi:hypothetical protein
VKVINRALFVSTNREERMNQHSISRPDNLRDESHAKAIVYNWMKHAQREAVSNLKNLGDKTSQSPKGKKYNLNKIITPILDATDSVLVLRSDKKIKKTIRPTIPPVINTVYFELRQRISHPDISNDFQYTPLIFNDFDTKTMKQQKVLMCLLTDHFLARLLMRTEARNLRGLLDGLITLTNTLMTAIPKDKIPKTDFVVVTENEIIPMVYFEMNSCPTLRTKTYIPRIEWFGSTKKVCEGIISQFSSTHNCSLIYSKDFDKMKLEAR